MPTLDVEVGFRLLAEEAARHKMMIDVRSLQPGETLARAQDWVNGALCVLCHVAIEPAVA